MKTTNVKLGDYKTTKMGKILVSFAVERDSFRESKREVKYYDYLWLKTEAEIKKAVLEAVGEDELRKGKGRLNSNNPLRYILRDHAIVRRNNLRKEIRERLEKLFATGG